ETRRPTAAANGREEDGGVVAAHGRKEKRTVGAVAARTERRGRSVAAVAGCERKENGRDGRTGGRRK
ncbi:hypothetical protein CSA_015440, partial [Cucumis sativus]